MAALRIMLCSLFVGFISAAVPVDSDTYQTYFIEDHCGALDDISVKSMATLRLRREDRIYESVSGTCKLHLSMKPADPNHTLQMTIRKFHLSDRSPQGVCLKHFLQMSDDSKNGILRMCQKLETFKLKEPHILEGGEVDFYYFRNVSLIADYDIELTVVALVKPDQLGNCPPASPKMFQCSRDEWCLPAALECDGVADCADRSDENDCSSPEIVPKSNDKPAVPILPKNDIASVLKKYESGSSRKANIIIIGVSSGIIVVALVAIIALIVVRRNRRNRADFQQVSTTEPSSQEFDNRRNAPKEAAV